MKSKSKEVAVVVTTEQRGNFFGYATGPIDGKSIVLKRARVCEYWPPAVRGFLGLASGGPKDGRVSPAADITLHNVICVAIATPEAIAVWESAPWK